jgi:uncharacterized protein YjbI with pentapeptide repeats
VTNTPTPTELTQILAQHREWHESNGARGACANLDRAYLGGAHLYGAHLYGTYLGGANLYGANLEGAHLDGAYLDGANLDGANLEGANLGGANLEGANLYGAYLYGACLYGAHLNGASLNNACLNYANLNNACLYGAYLNGANLYGANLNGAHLNYADLNGARGLTAEQLRSANLAPIRDDLYAVLDAALNEVAGLLAALDAGRIDGTSYDGGCACLVGTIAHVRGCNYKSIGGLLPDSSRPAERWFLAITPGLTPANHPVAEITADWIRQWMATHAQKATV